MQSANLSGPFRGCLYYALLGLPQATGLAGGYDFEPFLIRKALLAKERKRKKEQKNFSNKRILTLHSTMKEVQ